MAVLLFVVEQERKHFVFLILVEDFYVLTMHENIYEIQLVQNSSLLIAVFVADQVHVYVDVEYKATQTKYKNNIAIFDIPRHFSQQISLR